MDTKEQIARIIWRRFASRLFVNSAIEAWEDEANKAEFLDTAKEILWKIAPQCRNCTRHRMDVPFVLGREFECIECNPEFGGPSVYRTAPKPSVSESQTDAPERDRS